MNPWAPPADGPRIFGLRLREPLTLGHVLLLEELGSPILSGGQVAPGDVALAVLVVSQPHRDARKAVRSWWAPLLMRWWGKRSASEDFDAAANQFLDWFVESIKPPAFWREAGAQDRECAAPWWINRIALAMGNLGMSYDQAVDMPAKRLGQLTMAYSEARGEVRLVTQREIEFREIVARIEAEKSAAQRN